VLTRSECFFECLLGLEVDAGISHVHVSLGGEDFAKSKPLLLYSIMPHADYTSRNARVSQRKFDII
jgi:hypothetical protein